MLVFNCTKAAAEFFTVTRKGEKISALTKAPTDSVLDRGSNAQPISQWLIHAIKIQRKHVLIAMNVHTRYSMVFCELKKGDWHDFLNLMIERLFNNMMFFNDQFELGGETAFDTMFQRFIHQHSSPYFCQRGDRSVQSHINDVAWQFENRVYEMGVLPNNQEQAASFDEWINQMLRSTKQSSEHFYPDEEMFIEWMTQYRGADSSGIPETSIRSHFSALRKSTLEDLFFKEQYLHEKHVAIETDLDAKEAIKEQPNNVIDFLAEKNKRNKR